jgi:predicted ArsR family transcriptional regulator
LLAYILANAPAAGLDSFLAGLASHLVPRQPGDANAHITRKLAWTIEQLNRQGYAARWEAHAAAPRIIFERCPYSAVIGKHPELCQVDAFILRQQLGFEVQQTACLEKNARGMPFCQFAIGK